MSTFAYLVTLLMAFGDPIVSHQATAPRQREVWADRSKWVAGAGTLRIRVCDGLVGVHAATIVCPLPPD
jgi:hypothetical protein